MVDESRDDEAWAVETPGEGLEQRGQVFGHGGAFLHLASPPLASR